MSGDHNMHQKPRSYLDDFECPRCGHCCQQQTEQEPVAWMYVNDDGECEQIEYGPVFDDPGVTPLYNAPPKKEWVGLTDQEIHEIDGYGSCARLTTLQIVETLKGITRSRSCDISEC